MKYTDEELLASIKSYYDTHGELPKASDFCLKNALPSRGTIQKRFGSWNNAITLANLTPIKVKKPNKYWDKDKIVEAIQYFYKANNRNPTQRDFSNNRYYPDHKTVLKFYDSWYAALLDSGLQPDYNIGWGINTKSLDGHLYRSRAEAYFADSFLYEKFIYVIEPAYPQAYNKYYDWYIIDLDLYIELDGGIRPNTIKEKTEINRILNRKCLIIPSSSIYNKTSLYSFM